MQLFLLLALSLFVAADYHQDALWEGSNFFSNFNFVNAPDPTHGYVDFVSKEEAYSSGLVRDSSSPVYMGADHTNVASGSGRKSVRLESHTTWTVSPGSSTYLFVLDLQHMPTGCGTWPAWWFFGPNWPANGEIDIVEGVHTQTFTQTTLHTSAGCGMGGQAGNWLSTVCESGGSNNAGCGQAGPGNSYGAPFNAHGGGVYAALWEHDRIAAFYFPRGGVPSDLARGSTTANPNSWGAPFATFPLGGNCPYNHFAQQAMTFDLTFCGDWAGATFGSACPGLGSCASYVQNNPGAFSEAYWSINFIKIFSQPNGQSSAPAPSTVSPVNVPPVANNNGGGNVPTGGNPPSGGSNGCTCQAKSGADQGLLQQALDWACGQVDCSAINPGGAQYNPNTLQAHASYAFNAYYQRHSGDSGSCNFNGAAQTVCSSNPSPSPGGSSGGSGCTCSAKSGASASALQAGLDWACGQVDCGPINPGGAQYNPNTLQAHASYAYNAYFQKHSSDSGACDFSGTAQKTCGSSNPPPPPPTGGSSGGSGCTCQAKSGASTSALQAGLDWACGQVDCGPINPGGAQYNPNTLQAHASYAYNAWYLKNNRNSGACDFSGTAQTVCGSSNPPPPPPTGGSSSSGCTCQAKSGANAGTLQGALDWACGQVDCSPINPGGAQYNPNTLQAHASYAFNAYFQKHSSDSGACDFSGTAQKVCGSSNPPPVARGCTCSAKSNANTGTLQGALDWVCGQVNCAAINPGGANFNPNTLQAHASWAFNAYYQAHSSQGAGACDFSGTASLSCSGSRESSGASDNGGLSNGEIAGIVVGCVIGAALVVLVVVVVYTRTVGRGDSV